MGKKKKTQDGMMERQSFQDAEKYPKQENGLPEDRFQNEVQTAVASQTNTKGADFINGGTKTGADSIVARTATVVKKKMAIKPISDTNLSDSKIVGGVSLGDSAAVMSVAGAQGSGISEDQSRVPYTKGGVRPNERYGKKISTDNFVINNVISEQIDPSFDEPKDLRESPDSVQGYNGRKQFKTARGKKLYGSHPASTLFERSMDFNGHSAVVHTTGQVINNIDYRSNYPKAAVNDNGEVIDQYFIQADKSNYLLKALNIVITNNHISNISFTEDKIIVPDALEARDQANMNWQVDANNVAKAVVKLQTELGRETTDKWSPLGYIIEQPYEFGMLFHDGEAILGALTGAAYKSAAHSLAYLQNKMAKEGVRGLPSIAEWLFEDLAKSSVSTYYDTFSKANIFPQDKIAYSQGSAAALIEMFDSTGKYTTKADFINQPRSLKFHLQAVDNNINPFHAKKEFYKALDKVFLFSTDDGKYNPTLPVHVTDEVLAMTPYSMNAWLSGWKNPYISNLTEAERASHGSFFKETGIVKGCNYSYNDIRNVYNWEYVDPFVAGLCRWLLRHEAALVKAYAVNGNANISLPIHFTNTTANTFSFMVCSASQDMAWMRNLIFRDYLFAGDQGVYVWEDLASMKEINPLYASQYQYKDYSAALSLGALSNVSKIRLYWPEYIVPREARYGDATGTGRENTPVASYYLPFYFNEEGINPEAASGIDVEKGCVMSFPLIRNGVNHEYNDIIYGMTERDVRLCLDRMVTIPVDVTVASNTNVKTGNHKANKFHYSSLRYDTNSDGRVIVTCVPGETLEALREWTYLATPRELGFLFPAPVNVLKPYVTPSGSVSVIPDAYITGAYGSYITSYFANGSVQSGTVIDRSASLSQSWIRCFADPRVSVYNTQYVSKTQLVPSISCVFDATLTESGDDMQIAYSITNPTLCTATSIYKLRSSELEKVENITNDNPSYTGAHSTFTIARLLWTIIQRKYNPINVFDCAWLGIADGGVTIPKTDGVICDPLEVAAYFGFAGTLASDFNQDVLNRLDIKDQLGMFYFEDEFIKSSLIFN